MKHHYTLAQIGFIIVNLPGRSHAELTEMFNERFGLSLSVQQVTTAAKNRGIRNGRNTRFPPGNKPFNKGLKGIRVSERTEFKKGNMPANYKPVGSERITRDGYTEIKVADPRTWRAKHVVLWEAEQGPVPAGHVLVFGDGDKQNLTLENLVLISRRELAVMNKRGLIGGSVDLTLAGKGVANVVMKIADRKRGAR